MKFASDFRSSAREALRGRWGLAVGAGFVASLLGAASGGVSYNININNANNSNGSIKESLANFPAEYVSVVIGIIIAIAVLALVFFVAMFILSSVVSTGYANFNTRLIDDDNPQIGNLFAYFKHWKNLSLANLLASLYIFLLTLLLIIPGIIAAYSYAMVPFILADNPEMRPSETLKMSKEMMRGNKWRLFCLNFSFIGWMFLCVFTLGIGNLWLRPYMNAAVADFYREISGTRPMIILEPETGYEQI